MSVRPKFAPLPCVQTEGSLNYGEHVYLPLIQCEAHFPRELFQAAVEQLIHHPEYNSTLILRSETISDISEGFPVEIPKFRGLVPLRCIHRRLLARRPGRDPSLEQYCTIYGAADIPNTLVLTPILPPGGTLPYYHPTVHHLAFRYIPEPDTLRIEVLAIKNTPTDLNSRLYRTCLALLDTLHRYGWGAVVHYKKRVVHDVLVPRESYQDLYLIMRERHRHLVDTWQEATDPLKHVFEDIGIATYLILLWKDSYPPLQHDTGVDSSEPWKQWPRPPAGFLDLGCGNGLLTHILTAEGYDGFGIDVRARTSWAHYPQSTQDHLHVHALDPTAASSAYIKPGTFIIGNHADELTPWVPVLSSLHSASGYISIPCCPWTFDTKYERSKNVIFPLPEDVYSSYDEFVEGLALGGEGNNKSSYSMYRIWLASLSVHCGWKVECETLRIPSTRNWAIVGRKRSEKVDGNENVLAIVQSVGDRGIFKPRKPEGKAGEH